MMIYKKKSISCVELLGLIFDYKDNFNLHIHNLFSQDAYQVNGVRRIKIFKNFDRK